MYYDIYGKPISRTDWLTKFSDHEYKIVARDELGGEHDRVTVSTVWLGLEHGHDADGKPFIFETMIFGLWRRQRNRSDATYEPCYRYTSKEQALMGHEACVAAVKRGQNFNDFDPLPGVTT